MDQDQEALKAAAFLAQALAIDTDPVTLASEMALIERDAISAVYTAQLDSSVGTAAFLVYVYLTAATEGDQSGEAAFVAALDTLQTAAERDAPGPRVVAHARTPGEGFILATTPATARALVGAAAIEKPDPTPADISITDPVQARREAAGELLRLLRAANTQATLWLAAIQAEGRLQPDAADIISFDDVETELALYLLDERSIQDLLRVLNLFITAAREGSASTAPGHGANGGT